jgi:hypothetical protein
MWYVLKSRIQCRICMLYYVSNLLGMGVSVSVSANVEKNRASE